MADGRFIPDEFAPKPQRDGNGNYTLGGYSWAQLRDVDGNGVEQGSFGQDSTEYAYTILCNWDDLELPGGDGVIARALGWSFRYDPPRGAGTLTSVTPILQRFPPFRHPRHGRLWCKRIASVKPHTFFDKTIYNFGPTSQHVYAVVTMALAAPDFELISDDDLATLVATNPVLPDKVTPVENYGEWSRYCTITQEEVTHSIQPERGSFIWAGKAPLDDKGKPQIFTLGAAILQAKERVNMLWRDVPSRWLMDPFRNPTNLRTIIGCVNKYTFFGNDPGTLLAEDPVITPHVLGVDGSLVSQKAGTTARSYDIGFRFLRWRPTNPDGSDPNNNNVDDVASGKAAAESGHNLFLNPNWFYYPIKTALPNNAPQNTPQYPVYRAADFGVAFAANPLG